MAENKNTMASRQPQVILINDNSEDIVGAAAIISEQIKEFRAITYDKNIGKIIAKYKPPVILFALTTVMESIELYSQLVEGNAVDHAHDAILLCKNKESGIAFRTCIKGLFDNYFVYQPLYEKFRLKIVVHNALLKHTVKKYEGITDDQFDAIDEELAELIDKGVECKNGMSGTIDECKAKIDEVVSTSSEVLNSSNNSPQQVLEAIAKDHIGPLLESLEKELMANLDGLVADMVEKKTLAAEVNKQNKQMSAKRGEQLQSTVKKKQLKDANKLDGNDSETNADVQDDNEIHLDEHGSEENEISLKDEIVLEPEVIEEAPAPKAKSVLVVEDNDLYREMLVKVLSDADYLVAEADDGLAALKLIKTKRYDCILMDLFMPKLDGLNTTKHINKTGGDNPVPVIALTGNKRKDLFKKWASMGIRGYIIKPSSRGEILEQVEKCVNEEKSTSDNA